MQHHCRKFAGPSTVTYACTSGHCDWPITITLRKWMMKLVTPNTSKCMDRFEASALMHSSGWKEETCKVLPLWLELTIISAWYSHIAYIEYMFILEQKSRIEGSSGHLMIRLWKSPSIFVWLMPSCRGFFFPFSFSILKHAGGIFYTSNFGKKLPNTVGWLYSL